MKIDVYAIVRVENAGVAFWSLYLFVSREKANEHMYERGWPQVRYGMGNDKLAIQKLSLCVNNLDLMRAVGEAKE